MLLVAGVFYDAGEIAAIRAEKVRLEAELEREQKEKETCEENGKLIEEERRVRRRMHKAEEEEKNKEKESLHQAAAVADAQEEPRDDDPGDGVGALFDNPAQRTERQIEQHLTLPTPGFTVTHQEFLICLNLASILRVLSKHDDCTRHGGMHSAC